MININRFCFLIGSALLSATANHAYADTSWPIEIRKVENGQPGEVMSLKHKQHFVWVKTPEGARILKSNVLLEVPLDLEAQKPTAANENTKIKVKGNKMLVGAGAMAERISLGGSQEIEIRLRAKKPTLMDENCEASGLRLQPTGAMAPFFLATTCPVVNKDLSLHLTFPSDVDLTQSTLFEALGKGESWRVYDLKKINAASSELGRFDFTYKGKTYTYALVSLRAEAAIKKTPESDFAIGLGMTQLKLSATDASGSDSKPFLRAEILPHKLWQNFGAGGVIETAVGLAAKANSMSYIQFAPYAFYNLGMTSGFALQPRLYYVISNQSSGSGTGFQTNQVGVGLTAVANFGKRWTARFEFMMESIGSQVIKSHSLMNVSILQKSLTSSLSWGGGAQMQSYTVLDTTSVSRKFDQMAFYAILAF